VAHAALGVRGAGAEDGIHLIYKQNSALHAVRKRKTEWKAIQWGREPKDAQGNTATYPQLCNLNPWQTAAARSQVSQGT
jgi:hypothetical protein